MKISRKKGFFGGLILAGATAIYTFSGVERSRELVSHERNEDIPIRSPVERVDGEISYVLINPTGRIPWAERTVYLINRFLRKPIYEVRVLQDGSTRDVLFPIYFHGPLFDQRELVSDNPSNVGAHLFEENDPGYQRFNVIPSGV